MNYAYMIGMKLMLIFVVLLLAGAINAQTQLDWPELKQQQKGVRERVYERQKDELTALTAAQKEQLAFLQSTSPSQDRVKEMLNIFVKERSDLLKDHARERMALEEKQAAERKLILPENPRKGQP